MNEKLLGYLRLMRPANLPTAAADIFAGIAIASTASLGSKFTLFFETSTIPHLVFASVFLYAGGVVLNDVFDAKLDAIERPERPIPSGLISITSASVFGVILLGVGIGLGFFVTIVSGSIATLLAVSVILYDAISKKYSFFGPLNMGICRGLNLILGISILGEVVFPAIALIPIIYIFAITLISRGEVHGDNKSHIIWAGVLYGIVLFSVLGLNFYFEHDMLYPSLFILFFGLAIYLPLLNAYKVNSPQSIKKAVISGVLSIVILDAALAIGFTAWWYGLLLLLLLPLSLLLSKLFAVT